MTDAPARRSRRPNRRRTTNKATTNKGSANQGPVHQYPELQPARDRLTGVGLFDADRLGRTADRLARSSPLDASAVSRLDHDLTQAESRLAARRAGVPKINYPPQLPVSQRHDDLAAAIQANQVVIVAGETGSGKTTQLPKLCLELGRGVRGLIGHTQPRRIAARAVAERVAEELDVALGEQVGYAIRFTDKVSDKTLVKLMTDGILLAEIGRDRMLRRYDTIIIDEAHERSLNIDFLLGYLQQLLPRRPDLKLIITSATIDPQRFATYFGDAPIVEVSGRGYPVEVRYRPVSDPDRPDVEDRDQVSAICYAVAELRREPAGDVLVFLSGEREIRDAADAVAGMQLPDTEVLPLYGRLSSAEQHRVFAAHRQRRIVLATNVAETSLTVPGIRYVIDTGTARISRYSSRTKVQLLPIEPVSQASATQRAGRCGRTAPGVCIRLYSEADFESRPVFTDPEILRTNLASVILQMAALDLGKVENFGFLDPPDRRQIADGLGLLAELGALVVEESASSTSAAGPPESTAREDARADARADAREDRPDTRGPRLTPTGRRLAQLPVDPRLARMIIEAENRGCLTDVLVLAAALSIQDPRERPAEHQQAADALHARFTDPTSDFFGYLALWRYLRERQSELSANQFRATCRREYLNYLRIREWQDLYTQLRQIVKSMGVTIGSQPADPEQVHRSLLAGLLSHIGMRDEARKDYLGARGARFAIFPGSALARKQPAFVMSAELVETSRLWGRVNATIQPEWAEELAVHLVRRSYSEPHWSRKRGEVVAAERVTLYGVPIVAGRTVGYQRVDPEMSRDLFVRHALVEGDWPSRHQFLQHNRQLIEDIRTLENRTRRRDLLVDDDVLFAFYDKRVPAAVTSARHFDAWWKKQRRESPDLLDLQRSDLLRDEAGTPSADAFPTTWTSGAFDLELSYRFEPGAQSDGVTVTIPLPLLGSTAVGGVDWQVPGLRAELVIALLRSLPKNLRREIVPIPDTAAAIIDRLPDEAPAGATALTVLLADELRRTRGVIIGADDWDLDKLPPHLRPNYRVVDGAGRTIGEGRDLAVLQKEFSAELVRTVQQATADLERSPVTADAIGDIPQSVERSVNGLPVIGYPALAEEGATVALRVFDSPQTQQRQMWRGTRRLLLSTVASPMRSLRASLTPRDRLVLGRSRYASLEELLQDSVVAAVEATMLRAGAPAWDQAGFDRLRSQVAEELPARALAVLRAAMQTVQAMQAAELALTGAIGPTVQAVAAAERRHLDGLVPPGFVSAVGADRLANLPRYLKAVEQRLADASRGADRDAERAAPVAVVRKDLDELRTRLGARAETPDIAAALTDIGWQIEELYVSLFAQQLGTARPVSVRRIQDAMDRLDPR